VAAITGIELGPDSCVIVAARRGKGAIDVSALHVVEPSEWPQHDAAVTAALDTARRAKRFPRRANVVVWGLPEDASAHDATSRASVRPITDAGFRVNTILTPSQALAALAKSRAARGSAGIIEAVAWLALDTHGAAIAIVRGGELLFSRTFEWSYQRGQNGSKSQMLQRYTLVAHLAPELRRGIEIVRSRHGATVSSVVTCGALPELRSLTMPLIEELDLEVETLDSTDGLRATGRAKEERFAEAAPALRLATAAATLRSAPANARRPALFRAAAVGIAAAGLSWLAYSLWSGAQATRTVHPIPPSRPQVSRPAATPSRAIAPQQQPGTADAARPATPVPPPPAATAAGEPPEVPPAAVKPVPPAVTAAPSPSSPARSTTPPALAPPIATPRVPPQPAPARTSSPSPAPAANPPAAPAPEARRPAAPQGKPPAPLQDPLPVIDSILIDANRRLAMVGGAIVRVGDSIGPRVVTQIEPNAIVLREPSGLQVRVPLRQGAPAERQMSPSSERSLRTIPVSPR
jgi:hypothetical protein